MYQCKVCLKHNKFYCNSELKIMKEHIKTKHRGALTGNDYHYQFCYAKLPGVKK